MIGESLRLELQNDPIRIVQIVPGPVMTNFGRHYPAALVNGLLQAFGEPPIFVAGQTLPAAAIAQFQDRARAVFASADDIARTVLFAVTQPIDLDLFEIVVRPGKDLPIGETVSGSGP
jgi:NADP-dependent 3-hydroxy acid dehydrogenase YdfG